ncbi:MAG: transglycosylase domain-containing protein [Chitinophagales bacterium]|nr:transglycosylase domain-containing protein [Chitinophagales bacterium]MDW8417768.1 transglycosylase domain-containing protein [Chitinophagales bacterium]
MPNHKNDFWSVFRRVQIVLWSGVLLVVLFFIGVNYGMLGEMPDLEKIQNPRSSISTSVWSADGEVLGTYFTENRIEVTYDELSPYLVKALVATEDKRFYNHSGIDLKGLFRAIILTGLLGREGGGGSTLTQQLAKNLFHQDFSSAGPLKRMSQKLKEWILAAKLERTFTKEEIINIYFNTIGFGYNSYGIKTASFTYFYKKPSELKAEEAALLVAMLNGPSYYNPRRHPERALERRNLVLSRMLEMKAITRPEYERLIKLPIKLNFHNPDFREGIGTYIREYIRQELIRWCEQNPKPDGSRWNIYEDGLNVFTTIDSRMQRYAEDAMREHLKALQDIFFKEWKGKEPWKFGSRANPDLLEKMIKQTERYKNMKAAGKSDKEIEQAFRTKTEMTIFSWHGDQSYSIDTVMTPLDSLRYYLQIIQVGFIAVDARSGKTLAWIGGPNIRYFQLDHVKKSTKRQVGSTMKPFLYGLALERNYEPCTPIPYVKPECPGIDANWNPDGTDKWKEGDLVPMKDGLAASDNRITARIMCEIGDPALLVEFARRLMIESPMDAVPSLCLGTADISLIEMVGAYTAFANLGVYSKPYFIEKITDKHGNVLAQFVPEQKEAIAPQTAYTLTQMLKGVVDYGTATRLRSKYGLKMPLAGKTGTTQGNADAWFIGYNPQLVAGAWVGFEQPSVHFISNASGAGATAALPIVGAFMRKCFNDKLLKLSTADFTFPDDSTFTINMDCSTQINTQP